MARAEEQATSVPAGSTPSFVALSADRRCRRLSASWAGLDRGYEQDRRVDLAAKCAPPEKTNERHYEVGNENGEEKEALMRCLSPAHLVVCVCALCVRPRLAPRASVPLRAVQPTLGQGSLPPSLLRPDSVPTQPSLAPSRPLLHCMRPEPPKEAEHNDRSGQRERRWWWWPTVVQTWRLVSGSACFFTVSRSLLMCVLKGLSHPDTCR